MNTGEYLHVIPAKINKYALLHVCRSIFPGRVFVCVTVCVRALVRFCKRYLFNADAVGSFIIYRCYFLLSIPHGNLTGKVHVHAMCYITHPRSIFPIKDKCLYV
jgi:hypothetical protein